MGASQRRKQRRAARWGVKDGAGARGGGSSAGTVARAVGGLAVRAPTSARAASGTEASASGRARARDETARPSGANANANANANARTRAVVVDLYTGEVESDAVLPYAVAHVLPLPSAAAAEDHHEPSATLLVDASEARAHVFPDTEEARLAAYADRSRMSFYTVDQTRAEVRGYTFLPAAFGAGSFDASHAWTAKFPTSRPSRAPIPPYQG